MLQPFLLATCAFLLLVNVSENEAAVNIPGAEEVTKFQLNFHEKQFSCAKYDGVAACYHNNWHKRDLQCSGSGCKAKNRFSYTPNKLMGGKCYCCKC